jgi:hypothetical protein
MGQLQSRQYPNQPEIGDAKQYEFSQEQLVYATPEIGFGDYSLDNFELRKKQVEKLFGKMESNLKMYMLYDNYDTKNEVILADLKKKTDNQEDELKNLIESRDLLMAVYTNKKDDTQEMTEDEKTISIVNHILFVILLAAIVFIIYKLYTYPLESSLSINNLIDIDNNNLSNLSTNELNDLDDIYEQRIQELEHLVNKTNNNIKNSELNSNINSNVTSTANSTANLNTSNNLTESNLKKKNKFKL